MRGGCHGEKAQGSGVELLHPPNVPCPTWATHAADAAAAPAAPPNAPDPAADLANTLAEQAVDRNMRNLEDYRRARGELTMRLATELAQAKNKLARSTTNSLDSVLATSQIKVYEAVLENALRTQAET